MTEMLVGINHIRDEVEILPTLGAEMSVIGLIGSATGADAAVFPLDTNVELNTYDTDKVAKLGTGFLADAIRGIVDQFGTDQGSAKVVVRRVALGASDAETVANVLGSNSNGTGIYGFVTAGEELGMTPRLIVPELTEYFTREAGTTGVTSAVKAGGNTGNGVLTLAAPAYGVGVKAGVYQVRCVGGTLAATSQAGSNTGNGTLGSLSVDAGAKKGAWKAVCHATAANGGNFVVQDPDGIIAGIAVVGSAFASGTGINFTISDGATDFALGDEFVITVVDAVPANGGVFSVTDPDGVVLAQATVGVAYDQVVKFTIADGAVDFAIGDGFDLTVSITGGTANANAIVAALPGILGQLRAHAICQGPSTSKQDFQDWRETIQSDRIIPLALKVKVQEGVSTVVRSFAPRVAGIAVRRDNEFDGRPFHSWANQPVYGIVGFDRIVRFSLVDPNTEGHDLIALNAGIGIRSEAGVEASIAGGGFVYWGTDTCSEDPLWQFYHINRGRDYIELSQVRTLRYYLGRFNITVQTVEAILNTMKSHLSTLKVDGDILDYRVGFEPDKNSPEELRLGNLQVMFRAEEPPVLRKLVISSRRYRDALINLARQVAVQLSSGEAA